MGAPSDLAWRGAVEELCSDCRRDLLFMEGPICDACLDRREGFVAPGFSKYAAFEPRPGSEDSRAPNVGEVFDEDPPDFSRPPRLLVDLVAGRILRVSGRVPLRAWI